MFHVEHRPVPVDLQEGTDHDRHRGQRASAGWHEGKRYITMHPFPAGMVGGFGPRHTYHLMIQEERTA